MVVDKAAEEITTASRGKIAVTWLLLAFIGLSLMYAVQRFDVHSDRLYAQMVPTSSFSSLMMEPQRDADGFLQPQVVLWIRQAQKGNEAIERVETKLDAQGKELVEIRKLQAQIVELLTKQSTGRMR